MAKMIKTANKESIASILRDSNYVRFGLVFSVTIVFTFILYPNLISFDHTYSIGDVAESNIKAPFDFFVEDEQATEEKRQSVLQDVITVYDNNSTLGDTLVMDINKGFAELRKLLEEVPLPQISTETDETVPIVIDDRQVSQEENLNEQSISPHERVWQNKQRFEDYLGLTLSDGPSEFLKMNNSPWK